VALPVTEKLRSCLDPDPLSVNRGDAGDPAASSTFRPCLVGRQVHGLPPDPTARVQDRDHALDMFARSLFPRQGQAGAKVASRAEGSIDRGDRRRKQPGVLPREPGFPIIGIVASGVWDSHRRDGRIINVNPTFDIGSTDCRKGHGCPLDG
jgi:hypothetical protein